MDLKLIVKQKVYLSEEDLREEYEGQELEDMLGLMGTMAHPMEIEEKLADITIDSSVFECVYVSPFDEDVIMLYTKANGEYKIANEDGVLEKIKHAIETNSDDDEPIV